MLFESFMDQIHFARLEVISHLCRFEQNKKPLLQILRGSNLFCPSQDDILEDINIVSNNLPIPLYPQICIITITLSLQTHILHFIYSTFPNNFLLFFRFFLYLIFPTFIYIHLHMPHHVSQYFFNMCPRLIVI